VRLTGSDLGIGHDGAGLVGHAPTDARQIDRLLSER
jgi:hypothetical protein